jgi:hypothetical protein
MRATHELTQKNNIVDFAIRQTKNKMINHEKQNTIIGDNIKHDGCDYTLLEATPKVCGSFGYWHCKTTNKICTYM